MSKTRRASHAGSWYSNNREELSNQLDDWLSKAARVQYPARAIIAPHAGYYYCGACGAHAYKQVNPENIKRIFILGPSHHVRLLGCAVSSVQQYQTPLYNLDIDLDMNEELLSTGKFERMSQDTDEDEHSLEMHLPFIAKVMSSKQGKFKIVPVLVGSLSTQKEREYGELFANYLSDPENFFVISSDFCHWGDRFNYKHYDKSKGEIWQSIEALDRAAMDLIEQLDPPAFSDYLKKYNNTICGRHPIGVLLNSVYALGQVNGHELSLKFTKYAQSSQCKSMRDSSVSYASAALTITSHN